MLNLIKTLPWIYRSTLEIWTLIDYNHSNEEAINAGLSSLKANWRTKFLLLTILITSFSSLVYEVIWGREMSFIFGTSAFAITTVLTTFMAGISLGSFYGGRIVDRIKKKYQFLALIQILIGLSCLATLYLLNLVKYPYLFIHDQLNGNFMLFNSVLFAFSFMILIVPTFLIGVAFPTVVKLYYNRLLAMGRSVGTTYTFDTLGGAAGALLTGFFLISTLGLSKTSILASLLNVTLGVITLLVFRQESIDISELQMVRDKAVALKLTGKNHKLVLALFFSSGFAALMFEVIWTRYIALIYGSSTQSFSIVLASFLAGLGLGSIVTGIYADKIRSKFITLSLVELLIGIMGMLLTLIFPAMEKWFLFIYFHTNIYFVFMLLLFLTCFTAILIPTMLMGATLPLLSAAYASSERTGTDVGRLYSVNSFGSIFGSFMAGFLVIPTLGLAYSSILTGLIYILVALVLICIFRGDLSSKKRRKVVMLVTAITMIGIVTTASFWQPNYIFNGVYYHGIRYENESEAYKMNNINNILLFKANSPLSEITVFKDLDTPNVYLKNNGKVEASLGDMNTQELISHLPISIQSYPKRVLLIGLGGGFSLSSILAYNAVKSVDVIEIDPMVVEACRTVLADYNNHSLDDPRTRIIIADGRNYLFSTNEKYDVIVSEPTHIWVSGVSNLFTKEFYEIGRSHLNKGGILSQWFPHYEMDNQTYLIALNTMRSVFPYLYEFQLGEDRIVLASTWRYDVYKNMNKSRLSSQRVDDNLNLAIKTSEKARDFILYTDDPGRSYYEYLTSYYKKGPAEIDNYIGHLDKTNSDDLPVLEFSTMRMLYKKFEE